MKTETIAALAIIGVATVWALGRTAASAAADAASAAADYTGGLLTGNNSLTTGARTTAYQGAGVLGTLGAAADAVAGGALSRAGESLGGWIYDITH